MTASLYQSLAALAGGCADVAWSSARRLVVVKVALRTDALGHAEDAGRRLRAQLDVMARTLPQVAGVGQQVVDAQRLIAAERDPARLGVVRVAVDHAEHLVV